MQGRLETSDHISKYLAGVPKDKDQVTIHHLLTHTAGVPDNFGGDYEAVSREEIVRKILAAPLESAPGVRYAYSNAGYSLLAALVERISGISWEEFARKYLFLPAHLKDTGYSSPHWERGRVAESFLPVRYPSPLDRPGPYWNLLGNGGVLSTVGDLYRWHQALKRDVLLSADEKKKMFAPHVLETPGGSTSYGYGWVVQKTSRGTTLVWHNGGSEEGFTSYLGRYLDEDAVIILLSNSVLSGSVQPIAFAPDILEKIVFGGEYAIPPARVSLSEKDLHRYQGTYRMSSGGSFLVSFKNGGLTIETQGRDAVGVLMYPDALSSSPLAARIKNVFDSMSAGDFAPLEDMVGPEAAPDHTKRFRMFWQEWESKLGRYHSAQILFTTPTGSRISTYLQLNFEKAARPFELHSGRAVLCSSVAAGYQPNQFSLQCLSVVTSFLTSTSDLARTSSYSS